MRLLGWFSVSSGHLGFGLAVIKCLFDLLSPFHVFHEALLEDVDEFLVLFIW